MNTTIVIPSVGVFQTSDNIYSFDERLVLLPAVNAAAGAV